MLRKWMQEPIFMQSPHLDLAKNYWQTHLQPNDFAIDMTCGNGHDTQFLAQLLPKGLVYSVDIQESALEKAHGRCKDFPHIRFLHQSHSLPITPLPSAPRLIVYNLGYLPGGDKSITTRTEDTLTSLGLSTQILDSTGALSITCYPGHDEGQREEKEILSWAKNLSSDKWRVCLHQWINQHRSPSLLWILRREQVLK